MTSTAANDIVLAFSGGLDTSFCVPWLNERDYAVHTVFCDTGGVSADERAAIEARATELGAASHRTVDGGEPLWRDFVVPFIHAGHSYQDQYPLLVSDRYLIVDAVAARAAELGTRKIAHGCTGMGNDQVRFDLTAMSLGDFEIVAPIREIQRNETDLRGYEMRYLAERGFDVPTAQRHYTINENLLGVTMSGGEIDRFEPPAPAARKLCAAREDWPTEPLRRTIGFVAGEAVSLDGHRMAGPDLLAELNAAFGRYGVGRGVYTGDTTIGLKGRIVYEAPGLVALTTARRALEEAVATRAQNRFKPVVARRWVELVFEGLFHDPLKRDLEAYLVSAARDVTGDVTIETQGGSVVAIALDSPNVLIDPHATYAQSADWGVEEAEGFIKLFGKSTLLHARVHRDAADAD